MQHFGCRCFANYLAYIQALINNMLKPALLLILGLFVAETLSAQMKSYNPKKDTIVYYLKYPNNVVYKKGDADYFRIILPPDPNSKTKLFGVNEFYPDGQIKLLGFSVNSDLYLSFQGTCTEYFANGHVKKITNYDKGTPTDTLITYYPNGKLYFKEKYKKKGDLILNECADSTGKILANNGNGYWVKYGRDFKLITGEGKVMDGLPEGEWHGIVNDSVKYSCVYSKGVVISGQDPEQLSDTKIFTAVKTEPRFKGGIESFNDFLLGNIHYPDNAKKNNIQGKVFVTFVVEKNGTLSNLRIATGIDKDLDAEALRVLKLSPPWIPGSQNGKPLRVQYTVPINFALEKAQ